MIYLMLMMGGSGIRFGTSIPKQYVQLKNGDPLFTYTLRKYANIDAISGILIVSNPEWIDYTRRVSEAILGEEKLLDVVPGGETRSHSVKNGVIRLHEIAKYDDAILIHDATNPFVDEFAVNQVLQVLNNYEVAVVGTKQYHTIYNKTEDDVLTKVISRDEVSSGYSPEVFKYYLLEDIYLHASDDVLKKMTSTVAMALDKEIAVKMVIADLINIKITIKHDFEAFNSLIEIDE